VKAPDYDQLLRLVKGGPKLAQALQGQSWIRIGIQGRANSQPLTSPDHESPLNAVKASETATVDGAGETITVAPIFAEFGELEQSNLVCNGPPSAPHSH
jgi:hypothetical protein